MGGQKLSVSRLLLIGYSYGSMIAGSPHLCVCVCVCVCMCTCKCACECVCLRARESAKERERDTGTAGGQTKGQSLEYETPQENTFYSKRTHFVVREHIHESPKP